jgi:hypothetical protein
MRPRVAPRRSGRSHSEAVADDERAPTHARQPPYGVGKHGSMNPEGRDGGDGIKPGHIARPVERRVRSGTAGFKLPLRYYIPVGSAPRGQAEQSP